MPIAQDEEIDLGPFARFVPREPGPVDTSDLGPFAQFVPVKNPATNDALLGKAPEAESDLGPFAQFVPKSPTPSTERVVATPRLGKQESILQSVFGTNIGTVLDNAVESTKIPSPEWLQPAEKFVRGWVTPQPEDATGTRGLKKPAYAPERVTGGQQVPAVNPATGVPTGETREIGNIEAGVTNMVQDFVSGATSVKGLIGFLPPVFIANLIHSAPDVIHQVQAAENTPAGSQERVEAGLGVVSSLVMAGLIGKGMTRKAPATPESVGEIPKAPMEGAEAVMPDGERGVYSEVAGRSDVAPQTGEVPVPPETPAPLERETPSSPSPDGLAEIVDSPTQTPLSDTPATPEVQRPTASENIGEGEVLPQEQTQPKPVEQMSPDEVYTYEKGQIKDSSVIFDVQDMSKAAGKGPLDSSELHRATTILTAAREQKPVNAAAVDQYGITLPEGYTKQGDLYVHESKPMPEGKVTPNENETNANAEANAQGQKEGQEVAPADTSVPPAVSEPVTVEGYRGEPASGTTAGVGAHKFYSADETEASRYGSVKKETLTFKNPFRAENWVEAKKKLGLPNETSMPQILDEAAKQGHDGVIWAHHGKTEFVKLSEPTPAFDKHSHPFMEEQKIPELEGVQLADGIETVKIDGNEVDVPKTRNATEVWKEEMNRKSLYEALRDCLV